MEYGRRRKSLFIHQEWRLSPFILYLGRLSGKGGVVEGYREVRGEKGERFKGMAFGTKPVCPVRPLSPLSFILAG